MNQPKISVIVPVYNAEKYLHRCIESILNQTFEDFEVLLINDGSTDQSPAICDEYAKIDSRVRVFHKENGGVSSARNVGLQNMIGEYSIHCDSDDWVDLNYLKTFNKVAISTNADIIWSDFIVKNKKTYTLIKEESDEVITSLINKLLLSKIHGSVWNKLIRNKVIIDNNITFFDGVDMCEDLLFVVECLLKSKKIKYVPLGLYYYRRDRLDSLASSFSIKKMQSKTYVFKRIENLIFNSSLKLNKNTLKTFKGLLKIDMLINPSISHDLWNSMLPISKKEIIYSNLSITMKILFLLRNSCCTFKIPSLLYSLKLKFKI